MSNLSSSVWFTCCCIGLTKRTLIYSKQILVKRSRCVLNIFSLVQNCTTSAVDKESPLPFMYIHCTPYTIWTNSTFKDIKNEELILIFYAIRVNIYVNIILQIYNTITWTCCMEIWFWNTWAKHKNSAARICIVYVMYIMDGEQKKV